MEREIILLRAGAIVWRGMVRPATKGGAPASALDYFQEAWRQALEAGAVEAGDAATVQFRSAPFVPLT